MGFEVAIGRAAAISKVATSNGHCSSLVYFNQKFFCQYSNVSPISKNILQRKNIALLASKAIKDARNLFLERDSRNFLVIILLFFAISLNKISLINNWIATVSLRIGTSEVGSNGWDRWVG